MLISLDAEKAFDSVRWSFLYKVLEKFGFHKSIIDTFQALYDSPSARIKVNGALSKAFTLEQDRDVQPHPCFLLYLLNHSANGYDRIVKLKD